MKTKERKVTFADRVALFVGCGIIGGVTGFVLGVSIVFLSGSTAGHLLTLQMPLALAAVFAVMGALAPDEAADRIADLWHVISDYWGPGKDD